MYLPCDYQEASFLFNRMTSNFLNRFSSVHCYFPCDWNGAQCMKDLCVRVDDVEVNHSFSLYFPSCSSVCIGPWQKISWYKVYQNFHKTPKYRRDESWNANPIFRAHVPWRYNYNMMKSKAFFIKHGSVVMPEQFQRCKDKGLIITADYWIVIVALKCH